MKSEAERAFLKELSALCQKHGLVAVPSYQGKPSAHDPMILTEFDEFWKEFLEDRVCGREEES